jgi:hypothetical protein
MLRAAHRPPEGRIRVHSGLRCITAQSGNVETLPLRASYHKFSRDVKWQTGNLL